MQSALAPAGPAARDVATLSAVLAIGAAVVLLLVMALVALCAVRDARPARAARWIVGGGIVFPAAVLGALLVYTAPMTSALSAPAPAGALRIELDGRQWWWEVRYPGPGGAPVVAANEVHVPAGATVDLALTSPDVIHSFWVPRLGGKVDMVPGRVNRLMLRADRPGVFRAQCAEYCGTQHAHMALMVVAHAPDAFEAWLSAEAGPARAPVTAEEARGLEAFLASGCGGCHAIRGTAALGRPGPDLTRVARRMTLAAGLLQNDRAALRAWVAAAGVLKPGNHMPSYGHLDAPTLDAIATYLASLR